MDLLAEILAKIQELAEHESAGGIRAAARHIEVAERHLARGRADRDDDAFNDVVYRTNQAFEGMLEEAYAILFGQETAKLSVHQIEQRFSNDGRLSSRLMIALQRYRQEWRNPSTHDHTLLFSEQDALLSIVSVSAFAAVLLDQVIASVSFRRQKEESERERVQLKEAIENYSTLDFDDQIVTLLIEFSNLFRGTPSGSEAELVGTLSGFLEAADPQVTVLTSTRFDNREADLVLRKQDVSAVLEVKRGTRSSYFLDAASEQVRSLLQAAKLQLGFVFVPPRHENDVMGVAKITWAGEDMQVVIVAPKQFVGESRTG